MAARGHTVEFLEARDNAQVQIGDNYYGGDTAEDGRRRVLIWLNPPGSGAPTSNRREPGTNLWFLDTDFFRNWHHGESRFLFLNGIVGCGKTTLLSSVADKCRANRQPNQLITAFYFSSTVNEGLDTNAFLRFLVAQLCEQHAIPIPLQDLHDRHNRSFPPTSPSDDDLKELVATLLRQPRSELYESDSVSNEAIAEIFLLVDGLDEIRDRSIRREVTGYLNELCSLSSTKHRILTTSRPEADILSSFRADRGWRVLPIPKDSVRADIEVYVNHELTRHDELEDLDDTVRERLLERLAGPGQNMFRWASLQLSRLLNAQLLLRPDIFAILNSLPKDLNETYDRILGEISTSHHDFASTALRWLTLSRQPLLLEELIEACSISFEDACRPSKERHLRPLDIVRLLPNLISVEPALPAGKGQRYDQDTHLVVLSHFSVKEYLLGDKMEAGLRRMFTVDPAAGHRFVSGACIGYLYWTNTESQRTEYYPLRQYAWDLWAIHCVSIEIGSSLEIEQEALTLCEAVASGKLSAELFDLSGEENSTSCLRKFNDMISQLPGTLHRANIFNTLSRPQFFPEFSEQPLYGHLRPKEIRLLEILPSVHWFVPIRCRLMKAKLDGRRSYEAVSYTWGQMYDSKVAWIDGQRMNIRSNLSQTLRGLRRPHEKRDLWIDAVCINQDDPQEKGRQVQIMPQIFASSSQVAIWIGEENAEDRWALHVIDCIDDVLRFGCSENSMASLAVALEGGQGQDPYTSLKSLFEKTWWSRIWVVQEAVMAPQATLLYGQHSLGLNALARIISHLPTVFSVMQQLVPNADSASLWQSSAWHKVTGLVTSREGFQLEGRLAFSRLVYATRYLNYYDPRDRFYSLLGMIPWEDAPVNYGVSPRDSITAIFATAILKEMNLDILSFISRPEDDFNTLGLPSWVSLCTWHEGYAHPVPLLDDKEAHESHEAFRASDRVMAGTFERSGKLVLDGWFVATLTDGVYEDYALRPFRRAEYARYIPERRIYETTIGCLSLVPIESRQGDLVYIFDGGKTPYILRLVKGEYRFVGECLVLGMMHGEFFTGAQRHKQPQRVYLV